MRFIDSIPQRGGDRHRHPTHLGRRLQQALLLLAVLAGALPPPALAQTWSSVQPMLAGRHRHGSATGSDGKLYAVGGLTGLQCLASVERYDSQSGWSPVAGMATPRCDPGVVFGADGYLYAIGGAKGNQSIALVERYDLATGTWHSRAPLNVDRARPAVAVGPDLRIYAIGGHSQPSSVAHNSIEVYDEKADKWTLLSVSAPQGGAYEAATGLDGNIYLFDTTPGGGWARFDGTTWTALGSQASVSNAGFSAATGPDGAIYLTAAGPGSPLWGAKGVNAYDSSGPTGAPPNLLESRGRPASAAADGRLVVSGGYRKSAPGVLPFVEAYGPLQAPLFANAAAGWRFDEPNGPTAVDATGHTTGAFVGSVPHAAGRVQKSVVFSGNNYLKVANSPAFAFGSGDFSFEGWLRWLPSGAGVTPILDKRTFVNGKYRGYSLFIYQNGRLGVQVANGNTYANYVTTSTAIKANTWTHVAAVVDRSTTKTVRLYINGVRDKDFVPLTGDVSNTAALTVARHSFDSLYYRGGLDELSLQNRALTWAEVRAVFLAGREGKQ